MATIADMPTPSVTKMSIGQLIDLMRDIRASRRVNKQRTKKARSQIKKQDTKTYTKLKNLTETQRNTLIDKMLAEVDG